MLFQVKACKSRRGGNPRKGLLCKQASSQEGGGEWLLLAGRFTDIRKALQNAKPFR
jgi:hypothetical protein